MDEDDEWADEPAGRSVVSPLVLVAVLGSVTAGCIQIALGEAVPEQTGVRGLSWGEGVAQILVGAALLVFASRRTAMWTVVVNSFAIATWSITSVVGISFLEGYEDAAGPVLADWIATVAAAIGGFAAILATAPSRDRLLGRTQRSYLPALALTTVAIVAAVFAVNTTDRVNDDDVDVVAGPSAPTTTRGAPTTDPTSPTTTDSATTTTTAAISTTAGPATTVAGAADQVWRLDASDEDIAAVEALIESTQAKLEGLSVDDALDAGYARFTRRNLVRRDHLADDAVLDPEAIEVLLVEEIAGEERIVGAMYLLDRYATAADIPSLGGPLLAWETATAGCLASDGSIVPADGEDCPPGSVAVRVPPRLRVWLEPVLTRSGAPRDEVECGVFVYLDLPPDADLADCA